MLCLFLTTFSCPCTLHKGHSDFPSVYGENNVRFLCHSFVMDVLKCKDQSSLHTKNKTGLDHDIAVLFVFI